MASSTLENLPAGSQVFIDSTIFIYHFTGVSSDCRAFLERCEREEVRASTSVIVLAEAAHRLMMIEAVANGLVTPGNVAKKLREKPELAKKLGMYQQQVASIPDMGIDVVVLDLDVVRRSSDLRTRHGLMVNDSLLCASALGSGVSAVASADRDFERVGEIQLFRPGDVG
jgi:predicted nucleic acid-binding protein